MSNNLKPCPFCGEQPKVYAFDGTGREGFTSGIRCENINCQVSAENGKPQPGEFDWNTRPLEDALRAERDAARAEVERLRVALASAGTSLVRNHVLTAVEIINQALEQKL